MPRLLIAGGLECERAAFAAELAHAWNSVPQEGEPDPDPMRLLEPAQVRDLTDLSYGSWILHGGHYTTKQAQAVRYATEVITIGVEAPQKGDRREYRAAKRGLHRVDAAAHQCHKLPYPMAKLLFLTPSTGDVHTVTIQTQMERFLSSFKAHECMDRYVDLQIAHWEAQEKDHV